MLAKIRDGGEPMPAYILTAIADVVWDAGAIVIRAHSGSAIMTCHLTPPCAMELHARLGKLLAQQAVVVPVSLDKKRKKKKRKHD